MRYLRFRGWLEQLAHDVGAIAAIHYEEVRRHAGTDAAHVYGGLMATLTAWAELRGIPYQGVPVGTWKRCLCSKGNASKDEVIEAIAAKGFSTESSDEADALGVLHWVIATNGGING
jgi:Holliday junction resolvasome RuvABC endonuclease subunit